MDDHLRICDFGSSRMLHTAAHTGWEMITLQGTPAYLSPKLRAEMDQLQQTNQIVRVQHDPFKSDVFSLGYSLLLLCLLQDSDCGRSPDMRVLIPQTIHTIQYSSNLKNILLWMMAVDEDPRPDFLQLRAILQPKPSVPPAVVLAPVKIGRQEQCCRHCPHQDDSHTFALQCGHTFRSRECFDAYVDGMKKGETVLCPQCFEPVSVEAAPSLPTEGREPKTKKCCCALL